MGIALDEAGAGWQALLNLRYDRSVMFSKYNHIVPAASYLPDRVLKWLHKHVPIEQSEDGWTLWMDAHYEAWCRKDRAKRVLTGNCPIREHTGDGDYVGRCDFACYNDVCPRHGRLSDYPTLDDREVAVTDRDFTREPS